MSKTEIFYPATLPEWRQWLEMNHQSKQSVWLVFYSKSSPKPSITWSEAVDVALCFGWIDSRRIKINHETSHQFFSRRKPKSTWSKINKEKVRELADAGLIAPAGYKSIEVAKQNGSWTFLDQVEELVIPEDLEKTFRKSPETHHYFSGLSKSAKKILLYGLLVAKRPETRQKRIEEIIALSAAKNKKSMN
jgi:uncharacterized protein YdeI (YjbR/CyaY-like superfamily)